MDHRSPDRVEIDALRDLAKDQIRTIAELGSKVDGKAQQVRNLVAQMECLQLRIQELERELARCQANGERLAEENRRLRLEGAA